MKTNLKLAVFALCLTALMPAAHAQLTIPGADGSDGALNITTNTVIDLSQAVTGVWDANNTANAGKGVYDPNKWAVVFKYSSVNIASNCTVTFSNHPSRAPVVWLVNGNISINGEVNLNGQDYHGDLIRLPEPGPGGFRGGAVEQVNLGHGGGFGPGGYYDDSGGYANYHEYGNPQILPLIGGSGGSGGNGVCKYNGAGGGGAILIAASGSIILDGTCRANGGNGYHWPHAGCSGWYGFHGSGGAIRIIANEILGAGRIETVSPYYPGRVRVEANSASSELSINPPTAAVSPNPLLIWPPNNAPTVKVISVAGQATPVDPRAPLSAAGADLTIAHSSAVNIVLQTANFPTNGTVNVYVKPRNAPQSILQANYASGDATLATWQLTTALPVNHTVIQARAVVN